MFRESKLRSNGTKRRIAALPLTVFAFMQVIFDVLLLPQVTILNAIFQARLFVGITRLLP